MSKELKTIDKLRLHLFDSKTIAEVYLTIPELEVKKRVEAIFAKLISEPTTSNKVLRELLRSEFDISEAQAYRDIGLATALWGNFQKASKEYYRYKVIAMLEETYEKARTAQDYKTMAVAADKIGKYTRLDQDDIEQINWEELIPPAFEPTSDVTLLGLPKIDEDKRAAMRRKYLKEVDMDIEEKQERVYVEDHEGA